MRRSQNYFSFLLILLIFIIAVNLSKCEINITLANGYNENEAPKNATGGPLIVLFNWNDKVRINEVNVNQLTIHMHLVVILKWFDDRLIISGQQNRNEVSIMVQSTGKIVKVMFLKQNKHFGI